MIETETGWTKEKPTVNGFYWWRLDEHDRPEVEWVTEGLIFGHGEREPTTVKDRVGEWLGPISPADAEQLVELRKVSEKTLRLIADLYDQDSIPLLMQYDVDGIKEALQRILNPKPEKETQGNEFEIRGTNAD